MWILGSLQTEMFFFYLPGFISLMVAVLYPNMGEVSLLYGLLATALIDSGHVYTTLWRTLLHAQERKSSSLYWIVPLLICLGFSFWYHLKIPGLWSFVVYATLYHHTRQVYGFSKWYQNLNQRNDKLSDYFLYTFAILPMFAYHFRNGAIGNYYSGEDLFLHPNQNIHFTLLGLWGAVVIFWIIREIKLWNSGIQETNRLLSVAFPMVIYAYCFFIGKTLTQVLFPLLFIHGVAYCGVMGQSLKRTQKRFTHLGFSLFVVFITALFFGLSESWFEENYHLLERVEQTWFTSFLIGLYLTPLFCHYVFDAMIWKKNHREAKLILGHKV